MDKVTPPALSRFLEGLAPRAEVLLLAQVGPGLDAEGVVDRLHAQFRDEAGSWPVSAWPQRYWERLLAWPALGEAARDVPDHPLYRLAPTRRLAVLLRLVAGFEPAGAARLMGLSEAAFRAMLVDAEDRLEAMGVDAAVLVRWQTGFQAQIRARSLARAKPEPVAGRRRWFGGRGHLVFWVSVALILLVGLAAWFWSPREHELADIARAGRTHTGSPAPLPATSVPEIDPDADAWLTDPALWLLLDEDRQVWSADVAWWSWLANQPGQGLPTTGQVRPRASAPAWSALDADTQALLAPVADLWASLPGDTRIDLAAQARHWLGLDLAGRAELRRRWQSELARAPIERAALQAQYAAWQDLAPREQAHLRKVAEDWAHVPEAARQAQIEAWTSLAPAIKDGWRFGPALGADMPILAGLLEFAPEDERIALLDVLRTFDTERRARLVTRLERMPAMVLAQWRERLRAAQPEERAALLADLTDRLAP